jgi:sugar lactone lactonase YvrE
MVAITWRALLVCALLVVTSAAPARAHPGSGIVVDRHGNVYFVRFGTGMIMKTTPAGVTTVFVPEGRVSLPHHLILGRDGFLYAASDNDGRVYRIDSTGRVNMFFDSRRIGQRTRVSVGAGGDPFTVDSAGNIYALAEPNAAAIVRISPQGAVTSLASNARFLPMHFRSMAWDASGALYASDATRIWRIVNDTATAIDPSQSVFEQPTGLAVDRDGNVYVADYAARRVFRLSPRGVINTPRHLARRRFRNPTGVALAGDTIYVLDNGSGSGAVWRITPDGADRIYTESLRGWYMPSLLYLVPVVLIGLLALNRWNKARSAKPLSAATLSH